MKRIAITISATLTALFASAQGTVDFVNNSSSPVYVNGFPSNVVMPPLDSPGAQFNVFYFALLTGPVGTTNPELLTFTGLYATNTAIAGILNGGINIPVPGWLPGTERSYAIAGWSDTLGHDWNPNWLVSLPPGPELAFGLSGIGTGVAGGATANGTLPALALFSNSNLQNGIILFQNFIPEPSVSALLLLGILALYLCSDRKKRKLHHTMITSEAQPIIGYGDATVLVASRGTWDSTIDKSNNYPAAANLATTLSCHAESQRREVAERDRSIQV